MADIGAYLSVQTQLNTTEALTTTVTLAKAAAHIANESILKQDGDRYSA
jgi:hypothetical protein